MQVKIQNKSVGELSTVYFFERLYNTKFVSIRPDWLKNPKTNANLELDGYSEKLKIAIEYGSHKQTHHRSTFFKDQKYIKFKDNHKKIRCKKLGISLVHVPDLDFKSKILDADFKAIILKEFARLNIQVPAKFNNTKFVIVERQDAYKINEIWTEVYASPNRNFFERKKRGYWRAAERLGIIHEVVDYFRSVSNKRPKITKQDILVDAKKCKTRSEFFQRFSGSYKKAIDLGILDQVCSKMKSIQVPHKYWEKNWKEKLKHCKTKQDVSKYPGFLGLLRSDRKNENKEAQLWYNGLVDKNVTKLWTIDLCLKDAKKHKTKKSWQTKNPNSYSASLRNGWHATCTAHMMDSTIVRKQAQKALGRRIRA